MSKLTRLSKSVLPYATTNNVIVQTFRALKTNFDSLGAGPCRNCPTDIDPSITDMSWDKLHDIISEVRKPIEYMFFDGIDKRIWLGDNCINQVVILQFASLGGSELLIYEKFIMHVGFHGALDAWNK